MTIQWGNTDRELHQGTCTLYTLKPAAKDMLSSITGHSRSAFICGHIQNAVNHF